MKKRLSIIFTWSSCLSIGLSLYLKTCWLISNESRSDIQQCELPNRLVSTTGFSVSRGHCGSTLLMISFCKNCSSISESRIKIANTVEWRQESPNQRISLFVITFPKTKIKQIHYFVAIHRRSNCLFTF